MPEYVTKGGEGTALDERTHAKEAQKTGQPRQFRVILLNDHYTTMEFVIEVLEQVFHKKRGEAMKIMLAVHRNGRGVAGVYVKAVAEAKIELTHRLAQDNGYPLKCAMEPDAGGGDQD